MSLRRSTHSRAERRAAPKPARIPSGDRLVYSPAEGLTSLDPWPATRLFTKVCAGLSKAALMLAVLGLILVLVCVQYQVIGRYIFNDTPTWAEALALLLVLYITAFGVAVGVRDAGHIGLESLLVLLPETLRLKLEILIHALVALFGGLMLDSGWTWTTLKWEEAKPMLGVPEGMDYLPLVIAGALIVLFSIEHIVALLRGRSVEAAWN